MLEKMLKMVKLFLIRTTTGLLTIDAEKDTINHYGSANEVNVKNCDFNSYHVFGKVAGTIKC